MLIQNTFNTLRRLIEVHIVNTYRTQIEINVRTKMQYHEYIMYDTQRKKKYEIIRQYLLIFFYIFTHIGKTIHWTTCFLFQVQSIINKKNVIFWYSNLIHWFVPHFKNIRIKSSTKYIVTEFTISRLRLGDNNRCKSRLMKPFFFAWFELFLDAISSFDSKLRFLYLIN